MLGLDRPFLQLFRRLLYLWVRTSVLPQDPVSLGLDPSTPVVYVLNRRFLSNLAVLARETEAAGLPPALGPLAIGATQESRSFFFLSRPDGWFKPSRPTYSVLLRRLVLAARSDPSFEVQIVPVSILWGRAPDKETSILRLLFAEGWSRRGRFKRFFTVLLHGRNTLVRFSEPLSLRMIADEGLSQELTLRKIARVLRTHFRRQRELAIGPDLSHRRTQLDGLLNAQRVQAAIEAEAAEAGPGADGEAARRRARRTARSYALEIMADYSYTLVLIGDRFLTWLWTRLYNGVEVSNLESLTGVARDHEIIYVPCHRSHIDYLLLSYVVYRQGLMVPHIAAGANLNLPVVGPILRRGGAFFLRRSFKGNRLYAAVFNEYLHMMISKGYPIEYFVEGGRSRTGRQLAPMAGMLAMTVQSFLRGAGQAEGGKPIVFLPVYIGYEKLFEGRTYIGELMGRPKKKESLLDLLLTVRELKKNFGKVHVNFGDPIPLADVLDQAHAGWREEIFPDDARPDWYTRGIDLLKQRIADGINSAAVANPVALASLALLATPRHALDAGMLERQLDGYRRLALAAPYAERARITPLDGAGIVAYCEELKLVQRQPHPLGDVLHFLPEDAVLSTYMRNNILHLYALPALLAALLSRNGSLGRAHLLRLAQTVYPFLRAELFLRWTEDELEAQVDRHLAVLAEMGWVVRSERADRHDGYAAPDASSDDFARLALLGEAVRPTLIRYFITLAMLGERGSGALTPAELEALCHLQAQRLSLLREFNAPEFFDKAIFRNFIDTLARSGRAELGEDGKLHFGDALRRMSGEARYVLPADVRQAILHMARLAGDTPAGKQAA